MKTILFFITLLCQQGQCLLVVVFTYNFAAARVEILLSLCFFFFFLLRSFYPPLVWFRGSEAGGGSSCFLAKLLSLCLCQTRIFLIWKCNPEVKNILFSALESCSVCYFGAAHPIPSARLAALVSQFCREVYFFRFGSMPSLSSAIAVANP